MSSLVGLGIGAAQFAAGLRPKKLTRFALVDDASQFIEFEATVSASHEGTSTITRHPVEEGANVTDHIRDEPETLELDVVVSNFPLIIAASLRASPSVPGGNPKTRAADAWEFIRDLRKQGKTVTASTKLRDYPNMAIRRQGTVQDKDTGEIVRMTISLEEIVIATTQTVNPPDPVNPSRTPREPIGKKPKVPATPAESAKAANTSAAFSILF